MSGAAGVVPANVLRYVNPGPLSGDAATSAQGGVGRVRLSGAEVADQVRGAAKDLQHAMASPGRLSSRATSTLAQVTPATAEQRKELDAAASTSAATAKKAKYGSVAAKFAKLWAEVPSVKWKELDKIALKVGIPELKAVGAKGTKSFLGFVAALPLAMADLKAHVTSSKQAAHYQEGADTFAARCRSCAAQPTGPGTRANLYGIDRESGPQAAEVAEAWLKHKEASNKSNLGGVALGATASLQSATEASMNIAYEASSKAASALKNAIPGVGVAGAVIGLATSAHALNKQMTVGADLSRQREGLAKAAEVVGGRQPEGMGGALSNVFKHAQARVEVRATANNIQMAGSGLAMAGSTFALAGNVATMTGVGAGAGVALAVTSMALSLMSLCATIGATVYECRQTKNDAVEKSVSTTEGLKNHFAGLEKGPELDAAKAELAGKNKFYALVHLAEQLQTADPTSKDFSNAQDLLKIAGLSEEHVQAIIILARQVPADQIDINSSAVNELAKALYGAPVGDVPTGSAQAARSPEADAGPAPQVRREQSADPVMLRRDDFIRV